jgi:BCCT, betaine/carnitine/choline family transporter
VHSVALAGVFGVFIACLSKGRKLWELIMHCFIVPYGICLLWFCIWGGIGMRQQRQAMELEVLGDKYFNNSAHFSVSGNDLCFDVPQDDIMIDDTIIFINRLPGVTPVCQFNDTIANHAALNVLNSFQFPETFQGQGMGTKLIFIYLVGCILFYISVSDSASFMVDNMASNGRKNNHWARRLFWSASVGALGTTLLSSGDAVALKSLQAAIIVCALPVAILLCFLLQSITLFCQAADKPCAKNEEAGDYIFPDQAEFGMPVYGGAFNVFEYIFSLGSVSSARIEMGMNLPTRFQVVEFVKGLLIPFVSLKQVLYTAYPESPKTNFATVACFAIFYVGWVVTFLASRGLPGLSGLAMTLFFLTGAMLGIIRNGFRNKYGLRSNSIGDWLASTFVWPQVLVQMRLHCLSPAPNHKVVTVAKEIEAPNRKVVAVANENEDDDVSV